MKNIYVFSGLGADKRVFDKIDFGNFNPVFIDWISPLKAESISEYALRISKNILDKNPILIGLSFGGMMSMEISKHLKSSKIILISSAENFLEIPFYFRMAGKLKVDKLLPTSLLLKSNFISEWLFGANDSESRKQLKLILKDTEPDFLKWALNKIANWDFIGTDINVHRIHGNSDKILPLRYTRPEIVINNGGHLMIIIQHQLISVAIKNILQA